MKHFLLASLLLGTLASHAQTSVRLPLRTVTLYQDGGAELHHRGEVTLPAGPAEVLLTGLSPALYGTSVQAEAGGAELEDVEIVDAPRATGAMPGTLADSLRQTEVSLRRFQTEQAVLVAETEFLQQNRTLASITPGKWVEEARRSAAYYSERMGALAERDVVVKAQIVAQTALAQTLRQRMGLVPGAADRPRTVLLRLNVAHAGTVRLDVGYKLFESNASGWEPDYDLRVEEADLAHLRVVSRARLTNSSGLPWTAIPVTLRTAVPDDAGNGIDRPTLDDPWSVSRRQSIGEGRLDNFAVKGKGSNGTATTDATTPELGTRLALAETVTLAPNATRSYKLAEQTLPLILEYLAVPKRDERVFLVGRIPQWYQVNFLAEDAKVFFRGAYVGETEVDTRAYADTLEVSLGRDPQVQLTRTKREDFENTVFTLGGNHLKTRLAYEINVKNTHPYPVRLRLLDQAPISQDKEVTVKVQEISGAVLDEKSGKLTWLFTLPAGASRRFRTAFTVDAPVGHRTSIRESRAIKNPKFR